MTLPPSRPRSVFLPVKDMLCSAEETGAGLPHHGNSSPGYKKTNLSTDKYPHFWNNSNNNNKERLGLTFSVFRDPFCPAAPARAPRHRG